jgi:AraC-like DNA-binding protein
MYDLFHTIYLLAALQGLLLSAFLFTKKANHTANRILAVATLALSLELVTVVYYAKGWYNHYPHLMGFTYPFPALYGPLFYLYTRLVSKKEEHLHRIDFLHFSPFFLIYCVTFPIFFYSAEEKITFLNNMLQNIHHPVFSFFDFAVSIQGITYTIFTFKIVTEYNRNIKESYSNIDLINLNWLRYLTFSGAVIWSIVALGNIAQMIGLHFADFNAMLNIPLSILIYLIGYMGLKQPEIFIDQDSYVSKSEQTTKYQRSGLSEENAEEIKKRILTLMETEKPYLNQNLTLQKLSEQLKTSSHNLSEVINTRMNQSYYDFINQYRVEEFKTRLKDPESERYNLLSIAFDSGFQSKGTFNSIFKKSTGMTPSEYKSSMNATSR